MTLKQALLSLPKIDGLWWDQCNGYLRHRKIAINIDSPSMEHLHAAAKSIGMEIWWMPTTTCRLYVAIFSAGFNEEMRYKGTHKIPALAIRAAFIAAVEYKLKEVKDAG